MSIYGITFDANKTAEQYDGALHNMCAKVFDGDITFAPKICSAILYRAAYCLPVYELEDGKQITVEEMVINWEGLIKQEMRKFLTFVSQIALGNTTNFRYVLYDCMLPELLGSLIPNWQEVYTALVKCYCGEKCRWKLTKAYRYDKLYPSFLKYYCKDLPH